MNVDKEIIKQQEDKAREFIKTLGSKRKFNPFTGEAQAEIDRLENQVESLKAITELAVKWLEEIASGGLTAESYVVIAVSALAEIERLSQ